MASKIDAIETVLVDLPTIRPHVLASSTMRTQTLVLVFVRFSDGAAGLGEATTIGGLSYGEESPEGIKLAIDTYIAPLILGMNGEEPAHILTRIAKNVVGNHFAKCAIETALFDAKAKRIGVPLSALFGGALRDSLEVAWTLASGQTAADIAEAERMLDERRHRIFKLKIGKRGVDADVAHVAAIKAAVGDRASVRVDVNQAWDRNAARRGAAMLRDAGCDLIEQPLPVHDWRGMARLSRESSVPIMADEALKGPHSAFDYASAEAADVFAVKIQQSGGLIGAQKVAAIADAANVSLYGGTMLEAGVATAASAHLFATFPNLQWGTELFGPLLMTEEILEEPLDYREFSLKVPTGAGLGVAVDADRLARFRRDKPGRLHAVSAKSVAS